MSAKENIREAGPDALWNIRAAAHRVFTSRDGDLVLAYLRKKYYDNRIKDEHMERQVGHRDVILDILNMVENQKHVLEKAQGRE